MTDFATALQTRMQELATQRALLDRLTKDENFARQFRKREDEERQRIEEARYQEQLAKGDRPPLRLRFEPGPPPGMSDEEQLEWRLQREQDRAIDRALRTRYMHELNAVSKDLNLLVQAQQALHQMQTDLRRTMHMQHTSNLAHFQEMQRRDQQNSKENTRLAVVSSCVSLLLGWMLSLLGTPGTLLHLFTH